MARLAIIIVNYNTGDVLHDCLNNLRKLDLPGSRIVVVDNSSKDGSADMVKTEFPQIDLVRSENNGLAAGYNLGIRMAGDCAFYLFLGTDAFPKTGCVTGVMDFLESNQSAGIATAKMVLRDGSYDLDAHRGFPTPWAAFAHFSGLGRLFPKSKIFNKYFLGWQDLSKPHEIDLCISHFMMVKKEVFEKTGLWDEDFFVYGEDVDFCWRTKQAGFKIYYLPQFECLHYKGVGVGIRKESSDVTKADEATKKRMKTESTRAMKLFYTKHMYRKYPWLLNKAVEVGISAMEKIRSTK